MTKKFWIQVIVLFLVPWMSPCFAASTPNDYAMSVAECRNDLAILDASFINLKNLGANVRDNFISNFFTYYANPEKYMEVSLNDFLAEYNARVITVPITYFEATQFSNAFANFTRVSHRIAITMDVPEAKKVFFRSMTEYFIGFLISLQSLEYRDYEHAESIKKMRELVLRQVSPFIGNIGSPGMSSISSWEKFYFYLVYSWQAGFPANVVEQTVQVLDQIIWNKESQEFEKKAAYALHTELAMLCYAQCIKPEIKKMEPIQSKLEDYQLSLFDSLMGLPKYPLWGLRSFGIYRAYLKLLRETNNSRYDEVHGDMLKSDWLGYFTQIWVYIKQVKEQPKDFLPLLGIALPQTIKFIQNSILIFLFVFPAWLVTLILAYFVSLFWGSNRPKFISVSEKYLIIGSPFWRRFLFHIKIILIGIFINLLQFVVPQYRNVKDGFRGKGNLVDKIVYAAIVIAISWLFASLKISFDSYI